MKKRLPDDFDYNRILRSWVFIRGIAFPNLRHPRSHFFDRLCGPPTERTARTASLDQRPNCYPTHASPEPPVLSRGAALNGCIRTRNTERARSRATSRIAPTPGRAVLASRIRKDPR